MKKFLLAFSLLITACSFAQNYNVNVGGIGYSSGPTTPSACPIDGYWFYKNTAPKGWLQCNGGAYTGSTSAVPAFGLLSGMNNASTVQIFSGNVVAGNVDIYTVPAGKRALGKLAHFNPSLMTNTYFAEVKISGTYYQVTSAVTPAFNINGVTDWTGFILEGGETFSINDTFGTALALTQVAVSGGTTTYTGTITNGGSNALTGHSVTIAGFTNSGNNVTCVAQTSSTTTFTCNTTTQSNETHAATWQDQTGLNLVGIIYLFDNTSPLKTVDITTFVNGNNTVYACCSAGHTTAVDAGFSSLFNSSASAGFTISNLTGGSLTYSANFVPSGSSVLSTNQVYSATINGSSTITGGAALNAVFNFGDLVSVNTTSTGKQIAWITVFEQ